MGDHITLTTWDQVQHYELERLVRQVGHHGKMALEPDTCDLCFMLRVLRTSSREEGATTRIAAALNSRRVQLAKELRP